MKRSTTKPQKQTSSVTSYIVCIGLMAILPLLIKKNHFELTQFKADVFLVVGLLFAVSFLIELLVKKVHLKFNTLSLLITAFAVTVFVSSLQHTQEFKDALIGYNGWRIGVLAVLLFTLVVLFVSGNPLGKNLFLDTLVIANLFVYVIGIIDCSNIFISELYGYIDHRLYFSYISTIGNTNWMVGYLCLSIPLLFMLYLKQENTSYKKCMLVVIVMGLLNCIISSSDGVYLGLGFMALFMVPYIFRNTEYVCDSLAVLMVFGITLLVFRYSGLFSEKILYLDGISKTVLEPYALIPFNVFSLSFYIFYKKRNRKDLTKLNRILSVTILSVLILCFAYLIYDLYTAAKTFDFSWGNNRGWVWQYSKIAFTGFNLFQIFFGYGPENLAGWYYDLSQQLNANYTVAHSELVQTLLSFGTVGLTIWISCWIYVFVSYFRNIKKEESLVVCFLPLAAYFIQSFVNSATTTNIAMLSIVAGLYIRKLIEIKSE